MLRPEEQLALHCAELWGLAPRVDVEALVRQRATLEEVDFPFDVDAVTLHPKGTRDTCRVLVKKDATRARRRFTLAHELGHILLPWHVVTTVSHIDLGDDWRALLTGMLAEVGVPEAEWLGIQRTLHGVFGAANNKANGAAEMFNYLVRHRVERDARLARLARHADFDRFVASRLPAILARR